MAKNMAKKLNKKNQFRLENWLSSAQKSYQAGDYVQAESLSKKILKLQSTNFTAQQILGYSAFRAKRFNEAVKYFSYLAKQQPNDEIYCVLGQAYAGLDDVKSSFQAYQQALKTNPRAYRAYNFLGLAFLKMGKVSEALKAFANAININNDYAEAHFHAAVQLDAMGRHSEAVKHYEFAYEADPRYNSARERVLYLLSRYELVASNELLARHKSWDALHQPKLMSSNWHTVADSDPDRPLKVAYISSAFNRHQMGVFVEPLLIFHSKNNIESFCYSESQGDDTLTERLKQLSDHWRETKGLSDIEMERMIRKDKIDIIVNLDGFNPGNRSSVLRLRPAPIQVSYLGYRASTGMRSMDYWIGDSVNLSDDIPEPASEKVIRLPRCYICYQPPEDAPEITIHDTQRSSTVFGLVAELPEVTDADIEIISNILLVTPGSRLNVTTFKRVTSLISDSFFQTFKSKGIDQSRISVSLIHSQEEVFASFQAMDLLLDTLSDSNNVSVCDALWMGLPVITLKGNRFAQRQTASILTAIGYDGWITDNKHDFIAKVIALTRKPELLHRLRTEQRQKIAQSELCNAFGLIHSLEQAYRQMWIDYLNTLEDQTHSDQESKRVAMS